MNTTTHTLMRPHSERDWNAITRFNFTCAIPGGAWLDFGNGDVNWYSFDYIAKFKPEAWIQRHLKKQGWMTGCWVDVDKAS